MALTLMARLLHNGVNLSILMPFLAATIPLLTMGVGIFWYKEPASIGRLTALLGSTALVVVATLI